MEMYVISRDAKVLSGWVSYLAKSERAREALIHTALVSILVHTAEHGNPATLNKFFGVLNTNDQRAVANFVRRFQVKMLEGKPGTPELDADGKTIPSDLAFLSVERKEWKILPDAMRKNGPASRFVPFAEEHLIKPTKAFPMFNQISIAREERMFLTNDFAKSVRTLFEKANKENAHVDGEMLKQLGKFADFVESRNAVIVESGEAEDEDTRRMSDETAVMVNNFMRHHVPSVAEIDGTVNKPTKAKYIAA